MIIFCVVLWIAQRFAPGPSERFTAYEIDNALSLMLDGQLMYGLSSDDEDEDNLEHGRKRGISNLGSELIIQHCRATYAVAVGRAKQELLKAIVDINGVTEGTERQPDAQRLLDRLNDALQYLATMGCPERAK